MRVGTIVTMVVVGSILAACGSDDSGDGGSGAAAGTGGSAGSAGSGGTAGGGAAGSAGTSGSGGSSSTLCTGIVGSCTSTAEGNCAEYGGTRSPETFTAYEETCKTDQTKTWAAGACSRESAIGACVFDTSGGPCSAVIYYPPAVEQDAMTACSGSNGTWTSP